MRLLRLRLANYRGIEKSEVEFGPEGLTLVEGPNEAGKTSMGESISLLFEYPVGEILGEEPYLAGREHLVMHGISEIIRIINLEAVLVRIVSGGPLKKRVWPCDGCTVSGCSQRRNERDWFPFIFQRWIFI